MIIIPTQYYTKWSAKKVQIETAALIPVFGQQEQQVLKMAKDFFHQSSLVKNLSSPTFFFVVAVFVIMYLNAKDDQYDRNAQHGLTRPIKFVVVDSKMYVNLTIFTLSELVQQRHNYSICCCLLIHRKHAKYCFTSVRQAYF